MNALPPLLSRCSVLLPMATVFLFRTPWRAIAHGVALDYKTQQVVKITACYDNSKPMANATVQVFSPNQPARAAIQSSTNAQGEFQFTPDWTGYWRVQVRQEAMGVILPCP